MTSFNDPVCALLGWLDGAPRGLATPYTTAIRQWRTAQSGMPFFEWAESHPEKRNLHKALTLYFEAMESVHHDNIMRWVRANPNGPGRTVWALGGETPVLNPDGSFATEYNHPNIPYTKTDHKGIVRMSPIWDNGKLKWQVLTLAPPPRRQASVTQVV